MTTTASACSNTASAAICPISSSVSFWFMGLPFGQGGLRNPHCRPAGNPALFSTRRRIKPARPFDSPLSLQAAKRARAVAQLADLLPQLTALMKAAGGEPALKAVA